MMGSSPSHPMQMYTFTRTNHTCTTQCRNTNHTTPALVTTIHVTRTTQHATRNTPHATRHTPHATRHTPHATRHHATTPPHTTQQASRFIYISHQLSLTFALVAYECLCSVLEGYLPSQVQGIIFISLTLLLLLYTYTSLFGSSLPLLLPPPIIT
jgi:hypothetical protein